jgi:hypothetical protein
VSKDLENKTKKELIEIISQLKEKLVDMQGVEAKQEASESVMAGKGFSIIKDLEGKMRLLDISFDFDTKVAKIAKETVFPANTFEYAMFQAKKHLVEVIMTSENINHLKEKKNG